jgi:hypothetical protein
MDQTPVSELFSDAICQFFHWRERRYSVPAHHNRQTNSFNTLGLLILIGNKTACELHNIYFTYVCSSSPLMQTLNIWQSPTSRPVWPWHFICVRKITRSNSDEVPGYPHWPSSSFPSIANTGKDRPLTYRVIQNDSSNFKWLYTWSLQIQSD